MDNTCIIGHKCLCRSTCCCSWKPLRLIHGLSCSCLRCLSLSHVLQLKLGLCSLCLCMLGSLSCCDRLLRSCRICFRSRGCRGRCTLCPCTITWRWRRRTISCLCIAILSLVCSSCCCCSTWILFKGLDLSLCLNKQPLQLVILLLQSPIGSRKKDYRALQFLDHHLLPSPRFPCGFSVLFEPNLASFGHRSAPDGLQVIGARDCLGFGRSVNTTNIFVRFCFEDMRTVIKVGPLG
mmetsp:Transcript_35114/g.71894  ORF Transcript_35114/g.71894 Transcript_35114/m.71894 type:complete len:236 (+) Transcript_35114:607-1314(+)